MNKNKQQGFHLVELMAVVVVLGILASIAMPIYSDYTKRARIAEVTSSLSDARIKVEQYFLDNRTYASFGGCPSSTSTFTYACTLNAASYSLAATGAAEMVGFGYTLNQSNTKASTTPWGNNTTCWVRAKGGKC
jgi:type IV pilus assembly protein PilE